MTSQRSLIGQHKTMTSPVRPELLRFSDVANGNGGGFENLGLELTDEQGKCYSLLTCARHATLQML